jgi:glutamate-ammonia-ligase adenylyltransferase
MSGANISTMRRSPTCTRSSARSMPTRATARSRSRPQCQARPRRHPRDRVLRPDPAADRRRPFPGAARSRDGGDARRAGSRGWITDEARDALTRQYWFLRRVEHAIQMVADEQTHTLPEDDEGLERIARLLGYRGEADSRRNFAPRLQAVEALCGAVRSRAGALVRRRQSCLHRRRRRSRIRCRPVVARLRATERHLPRHPHLAFRPLPRHAVGRGARAPDRTHAGAAASLRRDQARRRGAHALRRVPAGLPAGIQLFSLLQSNPALLKLIATIMGAAPRLPQIITRRPHVFDGLLDPR